MYFEYLISMIFWNAEARGEKFMINSGCYNEFWILLKLQNLSIFLIAVSTEISVSLIYFLPK